MKRQNRDLLAEQVAAVERELKSVTASDPGKLAELSQVVAGIAQRVELRKRQQSEQSASGPFDLLERRKKRPPWAETSYPVEPKLEGQFAALREEIMALRTQIAKPAARKKTKLTHKGKKTKLTHKDLTRLLSEKGLSGRDWAVKAGVDLKTVNMYLQKKRHPFPSSRKKLADALGLAPDLLPK